MGVCYNSFTDDGYTCSCEMPNPLVILMGVPLALFFSVSNPCSTLQPCQNNANCVDLTDGSYLCQCQPGYIGDACETGQLKKSRFHVCITQC